MSLKLIQKVVTSKDGTKIYAEATGDPTKPAIVFVHGLACAGTAFDELFKVPELQKNLHLIRYDARGHARSGMPETEEAYESIHYAEDFAAVCAEFKAEKPFYAGWSLAGSIAADICANNNPPPISGVIWLAALPYIGDVLPIVATPLVLSFLPGLTAPEDPTHALTARTGFCETLVAKDRLSSVPFADMQSWVGAATFLKPKCAGLLLARKQDPARLKEELGKGLPLCIIHGKEDLQINGFNVVEQMQPQAKDCEVHLLDKLGHIPFWEDPQLCADLILKFVKRVKQL